VSLGTVVTMPGRWVRVVQQKKKVVCSGTVSRIGRRNIDGRNWMKRKSIQVGDVITDDIMEKDHSDDKDKKTPVYKNVFISTAYCPYCDQILKDVPESVSGGLYYRACYKCGTRW